MTDAIVTVLDGRVWGIWFYGSVVLDDFRLGWSDIDFVALADGPIPKDRAERLRTLRQDMCEKEPGNPDPVLLQVCGAGILRRHCSHYLCHP